MYEIEIIIRLVLALVLGALVGIERTYAHKKAGMRTFALVSLGAALFVVLSEMVIAEYGYEIDPLRVAASIVSGVGFLGAGMIVLQKNVLQNLTTAAGVWVSAAMGTAVGFGLYVPAITATLLVMFVFTYMWNIESNFKKKIEKHSHDERHTNDE